MDFEILNDVSLKDFCTFKIGGSAKFLFIAHSNTQLIEVCKYCKLHNIEYKIIGLISIFLYFYGLVAIFMNLFLLHSAYCRLYIEGTAEQFSPYPQFKMSKIGWIRNIQQKYYDSQKKAFDENYAIMRKSKEILDEKRKNKKKKKR